MHALTSFLKPCLSQGWRARALESERVKCVKPASRRSGSQGDGHTSGTRPPPHFPDPHNRKHRINKQNLYRWSVGVALSPDRSATEYGVESICWRDEA